MLTRCRRFCATAWNAQVSRRCASSPSTSPLAEFEHMLESPSWSVRASLLTRSSSAPSALSEVEMHRLTRLAYLSPDARQRAALATDVSNILRFVEHIKDVNTDAVCALPTVLEHECLRLRVDKAEEGAVKEDVRRKKPSILENAGKTHSAFFVVPKVKEDDVTN